MIGYPGSKGGMGVCQQIISLMPRHDRYIEPYYGGGAVHQAMRPALASIASDIDADVIRYHQRTPLPATEYRVGCALELLASLLPTMTAGDLVYLDPPYLPATRVKSRLYNFETDADHHSLLLAMLPALPARVMLSGYRSELYDRALRDWHRHDFVAMTHGGPRIESVWCNFTPGHPFHDPRFVGRGYRQREVIRRRAKRWARMFANMPPGQQALVMAELASIIAGRGDGRGASGVLPARSRAGSRTATDGERILAQ